MRFVTDNLGLYSCRQTTTLRDAIAGLNANPYLFQIVTDETGRVLGTVTDGDLRRGLLRGVTLDDPVERVMNAHPTVFEKAVGVIPLQRLKDLGGFAPVVENGRLAGVMLERGDDPSPCAALIMAGGRGTRLGARTQGTPKPLLPVGDRPIIEHILQSLERARVSRVFISVHYLQDAIESYVAQRRNACSIEIVREEAPLGTAGALGLLPAFADPLIVLNGDLVTSVDLVAFSAFHLAHGNDATIGATEHVVELPFGVIRYDQDGAFERIDEKPTYRDFVSAGIYVLSERCRQLVPPGVRTDMPGVLNAARAAEFQVGVFPIHEYWKDVGRPADLDGADSDVRNRALEKNN